MSLGGIGIGFERMNDLLIPSEYQSTVSRLFLGWCIVCWIFAAVWFVIQGGKSRTAKRKKDA